MDFEFKNLDTVNTVKPCNNGFEGIYKSYLLKTDFCYYYGESKEKDIKVGSLKRTRSYPIFLFAISS